MPTAATPKTNTPARRGRPAASPKAILPDRDFADTLPPLTEDELALQAAIERFEKEGVPAPVKAKASAPNEPEVYEDPIVPQSPEWSEEDEDAERGLLPAGINPKNMKREEGRDRRKDHWVCTQLQSPYFGRCFAMPSGWNPSYGNFPPTKQVMTRLRDNSKLERTGIATS